MATSNGTNDANELARPGSDSVRFRCPTWFLGLTVWLSGAFGAATLLGLGLRVAGIPLPFLWAGLAYGLRLRGAAR